MLRYLIIILIFIAQHTCAQVYPADSLFQLFKKDVLTELRRYGQTAWDDETRLSYYTLLDKCPVDSLVRYADDPVPAIRCLVFAGLVKKNAKQPVLSAIFARYQSDTAIYTDSPTDVVISQTVAEFMQNMLRWKADKKNKLPEMNYAGMIKAIRDNYRINIPGIYHGVVPKDSLLTLDSLRCTVKGLTILLFTVSNGAWSVKTNNQFSESLKQQLAMLKPGEIITVDDILTEDENRVRRKLPSLVLEIE